MSDDSNEVFLEREQYEANVFDREFLEEFNVRTLDELNVEKLVVPRHEVLKKLNKKNAPVNSFWYALFQLKKFSGKKILDYCAGTGETSVIIAQGVSASIEAFDISPIAVKIADKRKGVNNVQNLITFRVMSAYDMKYEDNFFDLIYGNAVLHHLDLDKALMEINRVLKKDGVVVFREPFSGSSTLRKIRSLFPLKKGSSEYEHPITFENIEVISNGYNNFSVRFFGIFSRIDRFVKHKGFLTIIDGLDGFILDNIPFLKRFARTVVIIGRK